MIYEVNKMRFDMELILAFVDGASCATNTENDYALIEIYRRLGVFIKKYFEDLEDME